MAGFVVISDCRLLADAGRTFTQQNVFSFQPTAFNPQSVVCVSYFSCDPCEFMYVGVGLGCTMSSL